MLPKFFCLFSLVLLMISIKQKYVKPRKMVVTLQKTNVTNVTNVTNDTTITLHILAQHSI